jgi:hypothetical protein
LGRKGKKFAACLAALRRELVLSEIGPERLGFELIEKRFDFADGSAAAIA